MRIADEREASARAAELRSMVKEWCSLGDAASAKATAKRAATSGRARRKAEPYRASPR